MDLLTAASTFILAAIGATGMSARSGDRLRDAGTVFVRNWKKIVVIAAGVTIGSWLARIGAGPRMPNDLQVVVFGLLGAALVVRLIKLRNQRLRVEHPPAGGPNHDNGG
jgi:hypothetical protein